MGTWYVIQKTGTEQQCVIYNITDSPVPGKYLIKQISQNYLFGLAALRHKYSYTGELEMQQYGLPGNMKVQFPLNPVGSSKFTIFSSDYENVAGVFTCQALPLLHRQSASILSRTRELSATNIQKMRGMLAANGIDPSDLNHIQQVIVPNWCPMASTLKSIQNSFPLNFQVDGTEKDGGARKWSMEGLKMKIQTITCMKRKMGPCGCLKSNGLVLN